MTKMKWQVLLGVFVLSLCMDVSASACAAQGPFCSIRYHMRNQSRRVADNGLANECGGFPHDAPFGNWGVESKGAVVVDGNQFQGWKKVFSLATLKDQYQWNSCTADFPPPDCTNYNHPTGVCTQQLTTRGSNRYTTSSQLRKELVSCPMLGGGGCSDLNLTLMSVSPDVLSLYEIDPICTPFGCFITKTLVDRLITLVPPVTLLSCTSRFCAGPNPVPAPAVSAFGFDIFADIKIEVQGGNFEDISGMCQGQPCDFGECF